MKMLSKLLTVIGILFILSGGAAYALLTMVYIDYAHLAITVAAVSAGIGALVLIINSIINPINIKLPDIQQPQINLPPNIGANYKPQIMAKRRLGGIFNVVWWLVTFAIYLPISFYMDNWEISWVIILVSLTVHALINGLLSIGTQEQENNK